MEKDVILPFTFLFLANIAVLTSMTIISPQKYVRNELPGTDEWNRVIATAGCCESDPESPIGSTPFFVTLWCINALALIIASLQAYQARSIEIEYSEGKWILFVVLIILQAFLLGAPVAFLKRTDPPIYFCVTSIVIFIICTGTLGCIFVPKILYKREKDSKTKKRGFQNFNIPRQSNNIVLTSES